MNNDILSVTQFNTLVKDVLESLGIFKVKGEITEMRISPNKGLYITLSDGKSNLRIGGYAPQIKGIDLVEEGMEVLVEGSADIYIPYGTFSLKIVSIEPSGEGSLQIAYQKLKEKLDKEGLFADEHKQALPKYITKVALLTGKDSAAYSDFVKILKEHKTSLHILFYPVLVQGTKSVAEIKQAFEHAKQSDAQIIVLTRGGGSLEDLKSFNDEDLARQVFSSPKPVIVGVGHERDESICEFTADIRASTPSQAAYYLVKQNETFIDNVVSEGDNLADSLLTKIHEELSRSELALTNVDSQLVQMFELNKQNILALERILKSYDIRSILKRGYALVIKGTKSISRTTQIKKHDKLKTVLTDGSFNSEVLKISKK